MVLLVTCDNEQFHADKEVVERSVLIKNMLEGASQRASNFHFYSHKVSFKMLVKLTNPSLCPMSLPVY
jgi:hypothetical protein